MRVRTYFKKFDKVVATIKGTSIKNKDCKKDFHDAGLPPPPDYVITRWATWRRAALYYNENLNSSCSYHCQQLDKCMPLSQQSKRRYQCERFGVRLG